MVIDRKNWLFPNPPKGVSASAVLYSVIETAKANGLNIYSYLVHCMKEIAKPEPDIDSILPWKKFRVGSWGVLTVQPLVVEIIVNYIQGYE